MGKEAIIEVIERSVELIKLKVYIINIVNKIIKI